MCTVRSERSSWNMMTMTATAATATNVSIYSFKVYGFFCPFFASFLFVHSLVYISFKGKSWFSTFVEKTDERQHSWFFFSEAEQNFTQFKTYRKYWRFTLSFSSCRFLKNFSAVRHIYSPRHMGFDTRIHDLASSNIVTVHLFLVIDSWMLCGNTHVLQLCMNWMRVWVCEHAK